MAAHVVCYERGAQFAGGSVCMQFEGCVATLGGSHRVTHRSLTTLNAHSTHFGVAHRSVGGGKQKQRQGRVGGASGGAASCTLGLTNTLSWVRSGQCTQRAVHAAGASLLPSIDALRRRAWRQAAAARPRAGSGCEPHTTVLSGTDALRRTTMIPSRITMPGGRPPRPSSASRTPALLSSCTRRPMRTFLSRIAFLIWVPAPMPRGIRPVGCEMSWVKVGECWRTRDARVRVQSCFSDLGPRTDAERDQACTCRCVLCVVRFVMCAACHVCVCVGGGCTHYCRKHLQNSTPESLHCFALGHQRSHAASQLRHQVRSNAGACKVSQRGAWLQAAAVHTDIR